jgi:GT2 family glycosyltransferase
MSRSSEVVQHGGVVLGPWYGAYHAFEDRMLGAPGYSDLLLVARETSAVTGALMLTRKSLFDDLGGFDEVRFPVNFNDVDYCLRLREAGYRVVFTPHAHVRHLESVSRGIEIRSPAKTRMWREIDNLRTRWRDVIRDDPFFHPQFSVDTLPYRALKSHLGVPTLRTARVRRTSDRPKGF